jgi:tetratricopeptide (TPR) repeat protein
MRILLACLLLLSALGRADDFQQANQAYATRNFDQAVAGYKKVLASDNYANAWFNYGNALYRKDRLGDAALAYERALLAQPNHPEAAANLKFVRNKANARVKDEPWVEQALRYVAQPAAAWLLIGEAWLGLALVTFALLRRRSRVALALGIVLVILGIGGIGALHIARTELARVAIAVAPLDARTEPADRAALAENLGAGSRVQVLSVQGDWTYCVLPAGGRGWVPTKSIEPIVAARQG